MIKGDIMEKIMKKTTMESILKNIMNKKTEVEVETVIAQLHSDKGVYQGKITEVGSDYILLKLDDYIDKNTKKGFTYHPELIRMDKIVSVHRIENCEIINDKRK